MALGEADRDSSALTRGAIVDLLRCGDRTVDELADVLGLTGSALRSQIRALERDGLVRRKGVRRGGGAGKPASVYEVAPRAALVLSKAYMPVLSALIGALDARIDRSRLAALMREVGHRLAKGHPAPPKQLRARADLAARVLNDLGGLASVEERDGRLFVQGCGCPLSAAVAEAPEVCLAVEALLRDVTGGTVRSRCEQGQSPQCCYEVMAS